MLPGFNLGVLIRALTGCGTPRERAEAARKAFLCVIRTDNAMAVIIAEIGGAPAMLAVIAAPEPDFSSCDFVTALLTELRRLR
ncbi:hypothetical protein [Methylocystis sp. Sn-Cys]|uniref:hypothetical protein n=1 Tax=Methylocystis sp. Sn-Cys TaxID=1701263 RepID=UPI0019233970|nr:hypothetical protein [Methylocystis sp. Sn-Cys]MBL1258895.1 hypothetical protein [Methylocystis sp. Sn-Cys]